MAHHLELARTFAIAQRPEWRHVFCHAGVSRSTAIASSVLVCHHSDWIDAQIVEAERVVRPIALPNALLFCQTDRLLGRQLNRV